MNSIQFILNGEPVELETTEATQSVLQFLREDLQKCGTKEGCAEGDCGACVVVVADLDDDQVTYEAVNSCIQFVPTLHGKALYTVEYLTAESGQLHPVQQSLVDHHASQCGFCTPGFVMSMFALYQQGEQANRETINDALSGNLCRCTGYKPIIEACDHMFDYPPVKIDETALRAQLENIKRAAVEIDDNNSRYSAPVTLSELAAAVQARPEATLLAGGTDVGLWVTKQLRELPDVIYLGAVKELDEISITEDALRIGAAVSLERACQRIVEHYPSLTTFFRRFASLPVRNAGTLVGNIANGSPIGDSMPALIALGSSLTLRCGEQTREIPMEDLYLDYMKKSLRTGEFVEAVSIPLNIDARVAGYKLSKRFDQDISAVCAAFALQLDHNDRVASIRIAYGGMAAIPKRAVQTEALLTDRVWDEDSLQLAVDSLAKDFQPLSDMRASETYRARSAANLLKRFYLQTRTDAPLADTEVDVFQCEARSA